MLCSADAVIKALGGTSAVATLTGVGPSAVSNWKARGTIPSENFLALSEALASREMEADPAVFGFKTAEARA
jgi:DNA-binding transcriptional regulator YdaS (Cro superfamily)